MDLGNTSVFSDYRIALGYYVRAAISHHRRTNGCINALLQSSLSGVGRSVTAQTPPNDRDGDVERRCRDADGETDLRVRGVTLERVNGT